MTRRQLGRHARRHPILAVVAVLLGLAVLGAILRDSPGLVILAAIGAGGWAVSQIRRPAVRATARPGPALVRWSGPPVAPPNAWPGPADGGAQLAAVTAERDQLAAEVADLRRRLADAREAAHAAWDAAAERPPASRAESEVAGGKRAALLADPLGGVRELGGPR